MNLFTLLKAIKAAKTAGLHINTFAAKQAKALRSFIFKLWRKVAIKRPVVLFKRVAWDGDKSGSYDDCIMLSDYSFNGFTQGSKIWFCNLKSWSKEYGFDVKFV